MRMKTAQSQEVDVQIETLTGFRRQTRRSNQSKRAKKKTDHYSTDELFIIIIKISNDTIM